LLHHALYHIIALFGTLLGLFVPWPSSAVEDKLQVMFCDVGQGDVTLLHEPGCTVLIDAGRHDQNDVVPLLKKTGISKIDYLIATHPHADHIGQFPKVLQTFEVGEVWMSGWEHTTRTFERTLDAILATEADYHEPRTGENVRCGSLVLEILNPSAPVKDMHDGIALRVIHGTVRFLFTGDAEAHHEQDMLKRGHELAADILQLGHHGSRTSTSPRFLDAVNPELAIFSADPNSRYGHPHREIIGRLQARDIAVYGTSESGTITVISDGNGYEVASSRLHTSSWEWTPPDRTPKTCIDLNRADAESLQTLIHIGEKRAEAIIAGRPWNHVRELTAIHGIGGGRLQEILDQNWACVE
jgi:competence protein ComEC